MGLSLIELDFLGRLLRSGKTGAGGQILEFGESQTVGDPRSLLARISSLLGPEKTAHVQTAIAATENAKADYQRRYGPARAFYEAIFSPTGYYAIDLSPGPRILWTDLNQPFDLKRRFRICINNGTSEHVFNQANVFKAIHDHTEEGGLMIHWTPSMGWVNHGMFNMQTTSVFDLAFANGYRVEWVELGHKETFHRIEARDDVFAALKAQPKLAHACLCFALRKGADAPFVMPMQGQARGRDETAGTYESLFRSHNDRGWPGTRRINLALGKPARQSSTSRFSFSDDPEIDASGANNGVITGLFGFHTDIEDRPWWSVDLTKPQAVTEVRIYNRIDRPNIAERASRLRVLHSIDGEYWRELAAFPGPVHFGGADGTPLRIELKEPVHTQHIRIELLDRNFLHLDEVEVY